MKKNQKKIKKIALAGFFLTMFGCSSSETEGIVGTGFDISGAAQKGPFIVGSQVLFNVLSESGEPTTKTIVTETKDNLGNFNAVLEKPELVQISASGYHFNEITGEISNGVLTLRAVYLASSDVAQKAYVNVLTHLIQPRVIQLVKDGTEPNTAIEQAQSELINEFQPVFPVKEIPRFTNLNVYETEENLAIGNAYLLGLSASFYKYAIDSAESDNEVDSKLANALNNLADDLREDGKIADKELLAALTTASRKIVPEIVENNLRNRSLDVLSTSLEVPDMNLVLDTDGDGTINSNDTDANGDNVPDVETKGLFSRVLDSRYEIMTVKEAIDGYVAVAQVNNVNSDSSGKYLLKLSSEGFVQKSKKLNFIDKAHWVGQLFVDEEELYFLLYSADGSGNSQYNFVKTDANGTVVWEKTLQEGNLTGNTTMFKLNDGYLFTYAQAEDAQTSFFEFVNDKGEMVWQQKFDLAEYNALNQTEFDILEIYTAQPMTNGKLFFSGSLHKQILPPSFDHANPIQVSPTIPINESRVYIATVEANGENLTVTKTSLEASGFATLTASGNILVKNFGFENNIHVIDFSGAILHSSYVAALNDTNMPWLVSTNGNYALIGSALESGIEASLNADPQLLRQNQRSAIYVLTEQGEVVTEDSFIIPYTGSRQNGIPEYINSSVMSDNGYLFYGYKNSDNMNYFRITRTDSTGLTKE